MKVLRAPLYGAGCLWRGLRLLSTPGIRRYALAPLIINIVLLSALVIWAVSAFGQMVDTLIPELPQWLAWLSWVLWAVFALTTLLVLLVLFSIGANVIAAPFNTLLAEALERHLTGQAPRQRTPLFQSLRGVGPALASEARKLFYLLSWSLPLLVLMFIPGLNLLTGLAWLFVGAWINALDYADYPMGNHDLDFRQQRTLLARHRWEWLGLGGATMFATLIPLLNLAVIPAAVAGATLLWVERYGQEE